MIAVSQIDNEEVKKSLRQSFGDSNFLCIVPSCYRDKASKLGLELGDVEVTDPEWK